MNLQEKFRPNEWRMIQAINNDEVSGLTWLGLAVTYGIKPEGNTDQRRKAANDVYRKYKRLTEIPKHQVRPMEDLVQDVAAKLIGKRSESNPKRLFFDIETSYNIVKSWRVGYNINLNPEDIIHERAIITVAYKWEGESDVTVLTWDNGDDRRLVQEFLEVMNSADELVGHNIDKYDVKFIMSRALVHGFIGLPKYQTTDTLKVARKHFSLNSNKLDYIAQLLGLGHKLKHRGMAMWDDIILRNDRKALEEMIDYNVQDVFLTEDVYNRLKNYTEPKVNHTVLSGGESHTCPNCGSNELSHEKFYVTKAGTKSHLMRCKCKVSFTITDKKYRDHYATGQN